jgi:hypothetical protein
VTLITRYCLACGTDGEFEQPPCHDGLGGDCPEWACVRCGTAILLGAALTVEAGPAVLRHAA